MGMRIAFVTKHDIKSRKPWSGTVHYMAKALARHCGEVLDLGPLRIESERAVTKMGGWAGSLLKKRYDYSHSVYLSWLYGRKFSRLLSDADCDVVFAPEASTQIAFLETEAPVAYLSDITFALINDYYPGYSDLLALSTWEGETVERRAISRAGMLIYSSQWAADSAIDDYRADAGRILVAPFGANLDVIPGWGEIRRDRSAGKCTLLFLGVDWHRKGGDTAYEVLNMLIEQGLEAELVVCGCTPPPNTRLDNIRVVPFLDKDIKAYQLRFGDERRYREVSESCRSAYEERFNWDAWGRSVRGFLQDHLAARGTSA